MPCTCRHRGGRARGDANRRGLRCLQITASVLAPYISMGQCDAEGDAYEPDLAAFCAFSFPAVLLTLGPSRWAELQPLFNSLARDSQRKVRIPLSHSLHEVRRSAAVALGALCRVSRVACRVSRVARPPCLAVSVLLSWSWPLVGAGAGVGAGVGAGAGMCPCRLLHQPPPSHFTAHQIAKILGPSLAESDLLSAFHLYLKDVDEVKVGVIQSLARFLGALSPEYRCVPRRRRRAPRAAHLLTLPACNSRTYGVSVAGRATCRCWTRSSRAPRR